MSTSLVWLITGTSTGLGRDLAIAALSRGDKVIATARARSLSKLDDLKAQGANILELDVTSPLQTLHNIAKDAISLHGRVDVVVNNAGYIEVGALEENTPEETYNVFNTNVFGGLNVARAFLPYMRSQKSGTVVWIGSLGGWRGVGGAGLYASTKHAIRGISESLAIELQPLGLRSICFEFGYFRTSFLGDGHRSVYQPRIVDYHNICEATNTALQAYNGNQPGDPKKGVQVIIDVVTGEGAAKGKAPPHVVAVGTDCYNVVKLQCEKTLTRLEEWRDITVSTDF